MAIFRLPKIAANTPASEPKLSGTGTGAEAVWASQRTSGDK